MKNIQRADYSKPASTFIDKGITLEAKKLSGAESVRIDGYFIGDIDLDGYLQMGESGVIEGNVKIPFALIAGTIRGNINCSATLHLTSTAMIQGNIMCDNIIMDEGAVFFGYCKTQELFKEPAEIVVI